MTEDTAELEKTAERVIEVNEWFQPFEDYDDLPYNDTRTPDKNRSKDIFFELANVGRFKASLWWTEDMVDPNEAEGEKYLLVLPSSEEILDGNELKSKQEKMEARPMAFNIECENKELVGKSIPFKTEVELPSGQTISAGLDFMKIPFVKLPSGPTTFGNWEIGGNQFDHPAIPDVANIIGKIKLRIVPKE